jgi:hypothetical protein
MSHRIVTKAFLNRWGTILARLSIESDHKRTANAASVDGNPKIVAIETNSSRRICPGTNNNGQWPTEAEEDRMLGKRLSMFAALASATVVEDVSADLGGEIEGCLVWPAFSDIQPMVKGLAGKTHGRPPCLYRT